MSLFDDLALHKKNYYLTGIVGYYAWAVVKAPLYEAYNGYIRLPDDHPWLAFEDYMDIPAEVHGGITYANGNWVGFDTLHAWDVWPESPSFYHLKDNGILWTPKMVVSETKQFLDQAVVAKMEFDLTKQ